MVLTRHTQEIQGSSVMFGISTTSPSFTHEATEPVIKYNMLVTLG